MGQTIKITRVKALRFFVSGVTSKTLATLLLSCTKAVSQFNSAMRLAKSPPSTDKLFAAN
jgi:hypothetical protein